jgi:hypothetical protein
MLPMPIAVIDEPPMPLTDRAIVGLRVRKSDLSGEMWTVAPVST